MYLHAEANLASENRGFLSAVEDLKRSTTWWLSMPNWLLVPSPTSRGRAAERNRTQNASITMTKDGGAFDPGKITASGVQDTASFEAVINGSRRRRSSTTDLGDDTVFGEVIHDEN